MFHSYLNTLAKLGSGRLGLSPRGWIGVDIGSRAVKLAQVQRRGESWRIAGRWLLPHDGEQTVDQHALQRGECARTLQRLSSARGLFRGRQAAAALAMSHVELRAFEVPAGNRQELQNLVREEIAADSGAGDGEFTFDYWETGDPTQPTADVVRVAALSMPADLSARVFQDLLGARLECRVSDGIPCALARAVHLFDPRPDEPIAALDLGYTSPLFVVSVAGQPVFSRLLKGCGLSTFLLPIQEALELSPEEARQLLARVGLPRGDEPPASASAANTVQQLAAGALGALLGEVQRTLAYLGQKYSRLLPRRIVLFGGGAAIRNLAEHLSDKIETPTSTWSLQEGEGAAGDASDALYGVAAGLSMLAWEANTCT